jgi:heptose I phosphotransferase
MRHVRSFFNVAAGYQPLMRLAGLDVDSVFDHPEIRVWRSIPERENCTLDVATGDGQVVRLHIKRHHRGRGTRSPADDEADGIRLLQEKGIPTTPLVGWGRTESGRSFLITEDLSGHRAADKLLQERAVSFDDLLSPTADLAARLHAAGLHHRDLYLCHFFARPDAGNPDLRLIDAARVRRLPRWPFRRRWVVKDLAQFWYSTTALPVNDEQRYAWLAHYARRADVNHAGPLRAAVRRKAAWVARHDAKLRRTQPDRNVSIPGA